MIWIPFILLCIMVIGEIILIVLGIRIYKEWGDIKYLVFSFAYIVILLMTSSCIVLILDRKLL